MVGEEQEIVEELREVAQHQLAVDPLGVLGAATQKTLNRFLELIEMLLDHRLVLHPGGSYGRL